MFWFFVLFFPLYKLRDCRRMLLYAQWVCDQSKVMIFTRSQLPRPVTAVTTQSGTVHPSAWKQNTALGGWVGGQRYNQHALNQAESHWNTVKFYTLFKWILLYKTAEWGETLRSSLLSGCCWKIFDLLNHWFTTCLPGLMGKLEMLNIPLNLAVMFCTLWIVMNIFRNLTKTDHFYYR